MSVSPNNAPADDSVEDLDSILAAVYEWSACAPDPDAVVEALVIAVEAQVDHVRSLRQSSQC